MDLPKYGLDALARLSVRIEIEQCLCQILGGRFVLDELRNDEFAGQDVRRGGGETYAELHERLQAAADAIITRHPGQTVLVVTHGAALRSLVASVLGASLTQLHRIAIGGNTALSIVQVDHGALRLVSYNDTAHLDGGFQVSNAEGAGPRPLVREGKSE